MRRGVYRGRAVALLGIVAALAAAGSAGAATSASEAALAPEFVPGELIVRFKAGTSDAARSRTVSGRRGRVVGKLGLARAELVRLPAGTSVEAAAAAYEADSDVEFAEPNYLYRVAAVPNDPRFGDLWGLQQASDGDIDAPEAWELTTGSSSVVVAVIDTGIAYGHADLAPNMWTNGREIGGNGVDDDGNGRVDDLRGWDFVGGDAAPLDENGHGTHVAGTIGAHGNDGVGVVGVNWRVSLMALRAGDASGVFSTRAVADAIAYACANAARVVNGSFGGPGQSSSVTAAMSSPACASTLFVFAAGNDGANNDTTTSYPCNAPVASIVCVAASDRSDARPGFSNYGAQNVDIAAPGVSIVSTYGSGYASLSGTSMAAPHVAGVAALMLARAAALTPADLRGGLLTTADRVAGLVGLVATGGRLNARNAVAAVNAAAPVPPPPAPTAPTAAPPPAQPSAPASVPAPVAAPVRCVVPKLRGRTLAATRSVLRSKGCTIGKVTRAYSTTVRKGRVLRQSVRAGRQLPRGAKVGVVVSRGRR